MTRVSSKSFLDDWLTLIDEFCKAHQDEIAIAIESDLDLFLSWAENATPASDYNLKTANQIANMTARAFSVNDFEKLGREIAKIKFRPENKEIICSKTELIKYKLQMIE